MEIFALKWQPFYLNIILLHVTHGLAKLLHLALKQDKIWRAEENKFILF